MRRPRWLGSEPLVAGQSATSLDEQQHDIGNGGSDPLSECIEAAAQERLFDVSNPHRALFRFHAFYELEDDGSSGSGNVDDTVNEDTLLSSFCVMLNFHHAIFDGESIKVLLQHVQRLATLTASTAASLPAVAATVESSGNQAMTVSSTDPYFAYCRWAIAGFSISHGADMAYWIHHLRSWDPSSHLRFQPYTHAEGLSRASDGVVEPFTAKGGRKIRRLLTQDIVARLRSLGMRQHVGLYHILLTTFYITLYCTSLENEEKFKGNRYFKKRQQPASSAATDATSASTSADSPSTTAATAAAAAADSTPPALSTDDDSVVDLSIGSALSNRDSHGTGGIDLQSQCGLVANCVPFRLLFRPARCSLLSLLSQVRTLALNHVQHSMIPFAVLLALIGATQSPAASIACRGPCRNSLFSSAFLFEDQQYRQTIKRLPIGTQESNENQKLKEAASSSTSQLPSSSSSSSLPSHIDVELLELPDFGCIFELSLKVNELSGHDDSSSSVLLTWEYSDQLFTSQAIAQLDQRFHIVLEAILLQSTVATSGQKMESVRDLAQRIRREKTSTPKTEV